MPHLYVHLHVYGFLSKCSLSKLEKISLYTYDRIEILVCTWDAASPGITFPQAVCWSTWPTPLLGSGHLDKYKDHNFMFTAWNQHLQFVSQAGILFKSSSINDRILQYVTHYISCLNIISNDFLPEMAPTAPNRSFFPSIMEASHSTQPLMFKLEPRPALVNLES